MPFLTKGKTNWKYILIVLILSTIVGVGIFGYLRYFNEEISSLVKFPEIKKLKKASKESETAIPKNVEVTNELVNKIIDKVVPTEYDRKSACFRIDDLDGDNTNEIFIGALKTTPETYGAYEAYWVIVRPIDDRGNYEKLAEITLNKESNFVTSFWGKKENIIVGGWETNIFCKDGNFIDIDKDGKKEIISVVYTGADYGALGIFKIDWNLGKIDWVKIKKKDGSLEHAYFAYGGGAMYPIIFATKDFDSDGIDELIDERVDCSETRIGESCKFKISVYKWDGSVFTYNDKLSKILEDNPGLLEINREYINITP
jgi:hypothetical protein